MNLNLPILKILLSLVWISLVACDKTEQNMQDLLRQLKTNKISPIEELPKIKEYSSIEYEFTGLNDPFTPTITKIINNNANTGSVPANKNPTPRPDHLRTKEYLESYTLDSLIMVGTLQKLGQTWALIVDQTGMLHKVTIGNYLGQNSGKIVKLSEDSIDLQEIVSDQDGGWTTRNTHITKKN